MGEQVDPGSYRQALEVFSKGALAQLLYFASWEPVESLRSFIEVLSPCVAEKLEKEWPQATRRNRVDDLEKRAFRWLERSFWEDITHYPDDPLDNRTLRLKKLFDNTLRIPPRQGDGEHFPISVFIEYDSLLKLLEPLFKRRPAKVTRLPKKEATDFAVGTRKGERGLRRVRSKILEVLNEKRFQHWKRELIENVSRVIPVGFWPKEQEVWFTEDAIIELTAQTAALRIVGAKVNLTNEAVLKLVKKGKQMLPPKLLEKMEKANAAGGTDESWQFLNQIIKQNNSDILYLVKPSVP